MSAGSVCTIVLSGSGQVSAKARIYSGEIIIYEGADGAPNIDVRFDGDTVWLTQKHLAELFGVTIPTINEHIKNIYKEGELKEDSTIRKFLIVQKEGAREKVKQENWIMVLIQQLYVRLKYPREREENK